MRRQVALDDMEVGPAHGVRMHPNPDLLRAGFRHRNVGEP
jgi:hypothetical protein